MCAPSTPMLLYFASASQTTRRAKLCAQLCTASSHIFVAYVLVFSSKICTAMCALSPPTLFYSANAPKRCALWGRAPTLYPN